MPDRNPWGLRAIVILYVLGGLLCLFASGFFWGYKLIALVVLALSCFGIAYGLHNRVNWVRITFVIMLGASIPAAIGVAIYRTYLDDDPKHLSKLLTNLPLTVLVLWYLLRPQVRQLFHRSGR